MFMKDLLHTCGTGGTQGGTGGLCPLGVVRRTVLIDYFRPKHCCLQLAFPKS